jgi:hypothetical protein
MSTSETMGCPRPARKRRRRLYILGACLVVAVPVVALLARAVERMQDAADRSR